MIPVNMGHQHAEQPAAVVAAGVELLAHGLGCPVGSALYPRERRKVCREMGAEARVDQQVALRVPHQDRRRGEVTLVAERPAPDRESRPGFVRAGGQLVDGHAWRRGGLRKGPGPGRRHRKRRHDSTV